MQEDNFFYFCYTFLPLMLVYIIRSYYQYNCLLGFLNQGPVTISFSKNRSKNNDSYFKYSLITHAAALELFFFLYVHLFAALRKTLQKFTIDITLHRHR